MAGKNIFASSWVQIWRQRIAKGSPLPRLEEESHFGVVWDGMNNEKTNAPKRLGMGVLLHKCWKERGCLVPRINKGIGFFGGNEPIASLFGWTRCSIESRQILWRNWLNSSWEETGQPWRLTSLVLRHWPPAFLQFCRLVDGRVSYQKSTWRDLSRIPVRCMIFSWSSCLSKHLGSLEAGLQFW